MIHNSIMLTATVLFALLAAGILVPPESARAQGSSASAKRPESPFAYNRLALTPERGSVTLMNSVPSCVR